MPVLKYRDVSDMPDDTWHPKGSELLLRAIQDVWDLAHRTIRPRFPAGVYKHRSFEEAQILQEEWDLENFRAYRRRQVQERKLSRAD
jgi:hypothetical protein